MLVMDWIWMFALGSIGTIGGICCFAAFFSLRSWLLPRGGIAMATWDAAGTCGTARFVTLRHDHVQLATCWHVLHALILQHVAVVWFTV
jgi:hypothetical protein